MAKQIAQKTITTVFILGLLVLAILSVMGLVYLSQMAYSDEKCSGNNYCGGITKTQRNIARLAILALWVQFAWIVLGSVLQPVWKQ